MTFDATRFESLGSNCEFGFFLQANGNGATSLFKWAEVVGIDGLTHLLRNDFVDMFAYENIVPFNANMVMDRHYGIAWHSKFQSEAVDPSKPFSRINARFKTPEPERRALWQEQRGKLLHFVAKLRESLNSSERILVYKAWGNQIVSDEEIAGLQTVMRSYGPNTLLAVTVAETQNQIGTVHTVRPGLLRGYVDRFAPGHQADDFSREAWIAVCEAAQREVDRIERTDRKDRHPQTVLRRALSKVRSAIGR